MQILEIFILAEKKPFSKDYYYKNLKKGKVLMIRFILQKCVVKIYLKN